MQDRAGEQHKRHPRTGHHLCRRGGADSLAICWFRRKTGRERTSGEWKPLRLCAQRTTRKSRRCPAPAESALANPKRGYGKRRATCVEFHRDLLLEVVVRASPIELVLNCFQHRAKVRQPRAMSIHSNL